MQVLESFELEPENSTFLEVLPIFPKVSGIALFFLLVFHVFASFLNRLRHWI